MLELPSATVEMRAAALLMSGQQGGDLDLATRWLLMPGAEMPGSEMSGTETDDEGAENDGLRDVRVIVEVAGTSVLEAGEPLEIFVYAVGPSLDVRDAVALRLVEPAGYESQLLDAGVRALVTLRLEPGSEHDLRVLARSGDRFGLRRQAVSIPQSVDAASAVPAFPDESGRWLVVWPRDRPVADAARLATAQPQALPVLTAGNAVWLGDGGVGEELQEGTRAELRATGSSLEPVVLDVASGAVELPADLAPGVWDLTLESSVGTSRPVTVWIAAPDPAAADAALGAIPWPALVRRSQGDAFAAFEPERRERSRVQLPEDLMRRLDLVLDGYFEALATRAAGDAAGAARRLADLEAEAIDQLGEGGLELLLGQEALGFERLGRRLGDLGPLLGVIRLHLEAGGVHRERGRYRLAGLAVGTARRFGEAYAKAADEGGRHEVASVLTLLAGAFQQRGPLTDAVSLYREALGYRPGDPVALLGLGTVLARIGDARGAAEAFGQLLAADEDHHEARLRRAVMLQRLGDERDARVELLRVAGSDGADWVVSLAHQQLIRLDLEGGALEEAERRIGSSLQRWPDHRPFHMARARVADLRRDRVAVLEALADVDRPAGVDNEATEPGVSDPGGRTRFHESPPPDMEGLRRELTRLETERRPALAAALDRILQHRDLSPVGDAGKGGS